MFRISPETVCYIIFRARELDVVEDDVPADEGDEGSNPVDEGFRQILVPHGDDPTLAEISEAIEDLNEDEQAELVALMWLGRGDYTPSEWPEIVREARRRHTGPTASYLLGTPLLADYLHEGLVQMGGSCEGLERGHL